MLTLLIQRNFGLLWIAHTFSILGDYVFFIAITFWVYEQTGSAAATGAVLIASAVPGILFAPLAGICVDRWSRRAIMLVAEGARAVLFLALFGVIIAQPHALWSIYVVGFVQSAIATFFWSARGALLPQIIEPPTLLAGNALYMVSDCAVRIIAPSLSTLFLLTWGPAGIVLINAVTFVLSVGCICLLSTAHHPRSEESPAAPQITEAVVKRGQRMQAILTATRPAHGLFILGSIIAYTAGTLNIIIPVFVRATLSAGPLAFGWLLTAQAIGEGIMSVLLGRAPGRRGRVAVTRSISVCLAGGGCALMLIATIHALLPVLLSNLLFGAMTAGVTIRVLTLLQQRIPNRVLGRVLATSSAMQSLAQVTGMAVASIALAHISATWLILSNGGLYLLGSGLAWLLIGINDIHNV
ncbi:MFS transporter [Dictyobacter aurantiacus]|uniref:MFS transporter n=1 Tax=Dictyobacter aurantiacus TaxID=1936993 RepID=A0A401ZKG5_9CHLR|nr:MFS transporter [Dictyobacter aurantiacus]GCE07322.1 MFS transporter [Dictyobacter aurantiacus]